MVRVLATLLAVLFWAGTGAGPAAALDLSSLSADDTAALEKRLTDAGCLTGPAGGEALATAVAACPTQDPQLRIETGMHVGLIWRVAVDRACRIAATASEDKTLRLWSLPEGRLLRTLRVPIDAGNGGKLYATAVSPDGRFVAAGGWDAEWDSDKQVFVYVFDTATGDVVARAGAMDAAVFRLAFSPDGRWLAAMLGDGKGVRLVDTATWRIVASDTAYGSVSNGAAYTPDGRLVTAADDGKLRLYGPGPSFRKLREIATRGGRQPSSVAIEPGGKRLAVGYADSTKVDLYDTGTLAFRMSADTKADNGSFDGIAWRSDAARLVAGGRYFADGKISLLTFGPNGARVGAPLPISASAVEDIQACGAGFAIVAADPAFGLLDSAGRRAAWKESVAPDLRAQPGDSFALSGDAKRIRFPLRYGEPASVTVDLGAGTLSENAPAAGLSAPTAEGLPIADWRNSTTPTFAGQKIPLDANEESKAVAVRSDRTGFALGSDYWVRVFDRKGAELWHRAVPGVAWRTALSADGRIVVAAYGDGTIRWHRWSDGEELLALFVNRDTRAWVAWTPSGYYSASPGGEDMIGWHLNRGWGQAADFFPASRFRAKFARPDVIGRVLETLDEAAAVRQANTAAKRRDDPKPVIDVLPPVINIVLPADGASVDSGPVQIRYKVRSPSGKPVDRVDAFIDGAKVDAQGAARSVPAGGDGEGILTLPIPPHTAQVSLVAHSGALSSDAARIELTGTAPKAAAVDIPASDGDALKPSLYALLVGVTHYAHKELDLAYPAKDAQDLAAALQTQQGKLYKKVQVKVLTDKDATSTGIRYGLQWIQQQATSRDLVMVFIAGHGVTDPRNRFWFLSYDADPNLLSTAISQDDITDALYDLPGKKVLFLDACHSGAVLTQGARGLAKNDADLNSALSDFSQAEGGVVAYAASTGRELSLERDDWGHGAFTKALIEGFGEGRADLMHNGKITTSTLDAFLAERVKQLTGGQQHPVMSRPKTVPDFPLAVTRE